MPYLYVLNGLYRHKVFPLGSEKEGGLVVGQRDDADIRIRDPWISWTHARIVRDGQAAFAIEDLGSTNGTYVNCDRIGRRALAGDDVVFLGRTHVLFVAGDRPPSAPPSLSMSGRVGAALPGADDTTQGEATIRTAVPGVRQRIPALEMSQDSEVPLAGGAAAAIGPPPQAEITAELRGPFADVGRIEELDLLDAEDDDLLPLPPAAEVTLAELREPSRDAASDDHFEIDIAELGLGGLGDGEGAGRGAGPDAAALEAIAIHPLDASGEIDLRGDESARLKTELQARDAEIARLRAEVTRLKEQYLDL